MAQGAHQLNLGMLLEKSIAHMQETPHASPLCGFISNAKPLNKGDKCTNRSTTAIDYRGGKLYLCDYHAGCLGITLAEKKAELILRAYQIHILILTLHMLRGE